MKRKWLSMLLVVSLVLILGSACSNDDMAGEDNFEDEYEEFDDTEAIELDDPISKLRTTPGSSVQLIRDENYYSLDGVVECLEDVDYSSVGYVLNLEPTHKKHLYSPQCYGTIDGKNGFFSVGDVPIPVLNDDDVVAWYADDRIPTLGLAEVEFYGYAVSLWYGEYSGSYNFTIYDSESGEMVSKDGITNFEVLDSNGDVVGNYYDLDQNESYTISWFEGTQHCEYVLSATSKFYVDCTDRKYISADYEISGELTNDGYARYDLSNIPAGIYVVLDVDNPGRGGLIELD